MAARYMKTKRNILVGSTPGEKFLAKIIYGDTVTLEKLSEMIAETSALSQGDVYSVLIQLQKVLSWLLSEGIPVDLGKFGRLYPGIKAKAVNTYEEVTVDTILDFYIRFFPSKAFREVLKNQKFEFHEVEIKSHAPKPNPGP